jgi:hypothetical protein
MPPQQGNGLLDVIDGAGDFGTHGRDIRRSIWKVKLFSVGGPHALHAAARRSLAGHDGLI